MPLRSSLFLLALVFLIGCSGGGSSGGSTAAPPPGPQTKVSMQLKVDLGEQGREVIQASSSQAPLALVVAEVVDRSAQDPGSLSGYRVVAQGQASVSQSDSFAIITMDVPVGTWDLYVFGIDNTGAASAHASPQPITITPGVILRIQSSLQFDRQFVSINPSSAALVTGDTLTFTADVFLANGTISHAVTWSSDNPSVLTIDPNSGLATAVGVGNANVIAVSTVDPTLQGSAPVTVTQGIQQVRAVFSLASTTVTVGQTGLSFRTEVDFTDGTTDLDATPATYASDNPGVLTVDANTGAVTAIAPGTANVTSTFAGVTSLPVPITVNPATATRLVVITSGPTVIQSYRVDTATGALSAQDSITNSGIGIGYTTAGDNFIAYDCGNSICGAGVDAQGNLTAIPLTGTFNNINEMTGDGTNLYVDDIPVAGNDTITTFQFASNAFTQIGGPVDSGFANLTAMAFRTLVPALYLTTHNGGLPNQVVAALALNASGAPTGPVGAPATPGTLPSGVLVDPSGRHLLVAEADGTAGSVQSFDLDPSTGAIAGPLVSRPLAHPHVTSAGDPSASFVISQNGLFFYVLTNDGGANNFIESFALDQNTGNILPAGTPLTVSNQVFSIAVDPTGHFLYHADFVAGQILVSPIDQTTGLAGPPSVAASLTHPFKMKMLP